METDKKTAEDFYQSKNGGKSSLDATNDKEYITPVLAVILMEEYHLFKQKEEELSCEEIKNEGIKYLEEKYPGKEILKLPDINEGGEFIDFAMGLQIGYDLAKHKEEQVSDEDIKNAALDYIDYADDKDTLKTRYLTRDQYAKEAYMQGAKDCRDNNIYKT
jgi:hypothetical protein